MNTDKEILLRAAEYIEQGWTQGHFARDENEESVAPEDDKAVCWCLAGAVYKAYSASDLPGLYNLVSIWEAVDKAVEEHTDGEIESDIRFNDHEAQDASEVAKVLRKAAELAE